MKTKLIIILTICLWIMSGDITVNADITTFYAVDDCYTQIIAPNDNHDGSTLAVCSATTTSQPVRYNSLLKWDISALDGKVINSAKIRLYIYASGGTLPFYIRKIADDGWIEETVTWNTMPDRGDIIYQGLCGEPGGWNEHEHIWIAEYVDEEKGDFISVWYGAIGTDYAGDYNFYRDKEYDGGSVQPELVVNWSDPIEYPVNLFGGGFNTSTPYVELHWEWNYDLIDFFEVQNSSDGDSWTYLGQSTTTNYTDLQVNNGTERHYRIRACNLTDEVWSNSSFSDVNFDKVYFDMVVGGGGNGGVTGIFLIPTVIIIILICVLGLFYFRGKGR